MGKRKTIQPQQNEAAETVQQAAAELAKAAGVPAPKAAIASDATASSAPVQIASPEAAAAASAPRAVAPAPRGRVALLAASVAVAAVLGSVAGSLITPELHATPTVAKSAEGPASGSPELAQLASDMAALKTSLEANNRIATAQLARMSERFERVERAQSEPAAKLAKIADTLDHLEHRPPAAAAASDTTGSIVEPRKAADKPAEAKPAEAKAAEGARPAKPTVVDGWSIAGVRRGRIYVESRYGIFEVTPGVRLPNLGRVEDVARQNGQLVVVTSKGLIVR